MLISFGASRLARTHHKRLAMKEVSVLNLTFDPLRFEGVILSRKLCFGQHIREDIYALLGLRLAESPNQRHSAIEP